MFRLFGPALSQALAGTKNQHAYQEELPHDLSKIDELSYDKGLEYTNEGQLVMGVELLGKMIILWEQQQDSTFPNELAIQLKHLIISHHGEYEYGSPKLPMTLEANMLHHLDNLHAKIFQFTQAMASEANPDSSWTPYITSLGRKFYKHSTTSAAED